MFKNKKGFTQAPTLKREPRSRTSSLRDKQTLLQGGAGFTLVELLIVIALLGVIMTAAAISFTNSRKKVRDTKRISYMRQIKSAIVYFANDQGHYPDSSDGVSGNGEVIGDSAGVMETLLERYLSSMPGDPLYNGSTGIDDYFFAYDPTHTGCDSVVSINRFETSKALEEYGGRDTSSGGDMHIDTAHYNHCFE